MINLLPPHARTQVTHTYWSRVIAVWALLVCVAGVVGGLMLLPTYVLLSSHYNALQAEAAAMASTKDGAVATQNVIREANALAGSLVRMGTHESLGEILRALDAASDDTVTITAHSLTREASGHVDIFRVQGVAQSRAALTDFKDRLEKDPLFGSVDLPISDLVRDTDLPFTFDVVVNHDI